MISPPLAQQTGKRKREKRKKIMRRAAMSERVNHKKQLAIITTIEK